MARASATAPTASGGVRGCHTALASGENKAPWSGDSCSRPFMRVAPSAERSRRRSGTSLATTTTGTPEAADSPNAARVLAAPGPLVTSATPGPPVDRATPSAAYAAVCSCRTVMMRVPDVWRPSSSVPRQNAKLCTPGRPKTVTTPAAASRSRIASAVVAARAVLTRESSHSRLRQDVRHARGSTHWSAVKAPCE